MSKRKVGIVGFGNLGKYLYEKIRTDPKASAQLEVGWIYNRTPEALDSLNVPQELRLHSLTDVGNHPVDIIVEVAHPDITRQYGLLFLQYSDLFIGSPTVFADKNVEAQIREASRTGKHGVYVPSGALWGADDIAKMGEAGTLRQLTITMKKHPNSLKVLPPLTEKIANYTPGVENVIFEGSVRELCPLAPNNVNTMACAALAAPNLGFDKTKARLVADDRLNAHIIEIEIVGPETPGYGEFRVSVTRTNPAPPGAVTGQATYGSFLSSLLRAHGRGNGFHFC